VSLNETELGFLDVFHHHQLKNLGNPPQYHAYLEGDDTLAYYVSQPRDDPPVSSTQPSSNVLDWTSGSSLLRTSTSYTHADPLQTPWFSVTSDSCNLAVSGQTFHNSSIELPSHLGSAHSPFISFSPQFPKPPLMAYGAPRVDVTANPADLLTFSGGNIPGCSIIASDLEVVQLLPAPMNKFTFMTTSTEGVVQVNKHDDATHQITSIRAPLRYRKSPNLFESPGKFACTICKRRFVRKGDWKRHESSQCSPQTIWVCMMGDKPAILTSAGWACSFCDAVEPGPDLTAIFDHLERAHRISKCLRKTMKSRSFKRKDKLKSHLSNVHALSATSDRWEGWHQRTATANVSRWACSFCGVELLTWESEFLHLVSKPPCVHIGLA
jgi:hypothetical protein